MLTYLVRKGSIERRSQGLYAFPDTEADNLPTAIKELLTVIPHAIVGHATALQLLGLTDELPGVTELLVPDRNAPKRRLKNVRLHRVRGDMKRLRVKRIRGIPVTTVEQTLVDLLRGGAPLSPLIEIFRLAQRKRLSPSVTEIARIAADFRAKARAKVLVEALI
jgi:predicted transcriptional regulator of viral defense system